LEDQFVSLNLASLLRSVRLGRPYQEHKFPAGIANKVTEARKSPSPPPPPDKVETFMLYKMCNAINPNFGDPPTCFNPLNAELNLICHLLALSGAHFILHVSRIRVNTRFSYCIFPNFKCTYKVVQIWPGLIFF
jgi:hypothetical protein